jgi:phenylacetate-CoA ligase
MVMPLRVLLKRRALERSCRWTRAELHAHRLRTLQTLRQFACRNSPFYRRFHRGLESRPLTELPILTKATLDPSAPGRSSVPGFWCDAVSGPLRGSRNVWQHRLALFSRREWLTSLASIARPIGWTGAKANPLRPVRTAMVASTAPSHYSARLGMSLSSRLIPTLRFDAAEPLETVVDRLNEWRPETVAAYNTYGATDYAPIAAECSHGRQHLFEDGAIIEIAGERGPVPPGAAGHRVLLTVFDRWTQPLIRYEISDMVRPFRSRGDQAVSMHPNAYIAGLRDTEVCSRIERSIRQFLDNEGAVLPSIRVAPIAELQRGATGKVPLILSRTAKKMGAAV